MTRPTYTLILAAVLLCFLAPLSRAQVLTRTVYLPEVATTASPTDDERRIAQTAANVLDLRLNSLRQIKAVRHKVPCDPPLAGLAVRQPEDAAEQMSPADLSTSVYEVSVALKTLIAPAGANSSLVLDYELFRYVRCKPTSIIHRSEPISLRTAFEVLLQMGDFVEVALTKDMENLAPPKLVVDLSEISGGGDSLQDVRNQLGNSVFFKLGTQPDFKARDARGKPPDSEADYIVTGELRTKEQKGVRFTIKSGKDNGKPEDFFVPGPVGQKNPDEKALAAFYDKAATMVASYLRARRDNTGPLSDADVVTISQQAFQLLCKDQSRMSECLSQPTVVIPMLTRLRDAEKASPKVLELLGEAYEEVEEYQKAADAYDQAWMKASPGRIDAETFRFQAKAANALYAAQNYAAAAERYAQAIATRAKLQLPVMEALFIQNARSHRFAGNRIQALNAALSGLNEFPDSAALNEDVSTVLKTLKDEELMTAYQSLTKYKNLGKVQQKLPGVTERLVEYLLLEALGNIFQTRKFDEADRTLKVIESFPLESISSDLQKLHKIVRAAWTREAKGDFDEAIAVLTPLAQEESELGELASYFLADSFYKRARRAGKNADRGDYERASELLRKSVEKGAASAEYLRFIAVNHELGKDQESLRIIQERLINQPADSGAIMALALLCIEYLDNLECGEKNIKRLESDPGWDVSLRLVRVNLYLRRRQYAEAEKLLETPSSVPQLALFYRVWSSLALNKEAQAETAAREWQVSMERIRASGQSSDSPLESAKRGVESEQVIPPGKKDLLRAMIAAMMDPGQPLPRLTDFFPASKSRD